MTGNEAVLFSLAVGFALLRALVLLLLPALPLLLSLLLPAVLLPTSPLRALPVADPGWAVRHSFSVAQTRLSPYPEIAALGCGVLFAPFLLYASSLAGMFRLGTILAPAGPWHIGFREFLYDRVWPLVSSPFQLIHLIASGEAPPDISRGSILLGLLALLLIVVPPLAVRTPSSRLHGLRNGLLVLSGAFAAVYMAALVLWIAHLLNFWSFLVLFVLTMLLRG